MVALSLFLSFVLEVVVKSLNACDPMQMQSRKIDSSIQASEKYSKQHVIQWWSEANHLPNQFQQLVRRFCDRLRLRLKLWNSISF